MTVLRPVREVTVEEENFRIVPVEGSRMSTVRRDPVEPEPVGTYVVMVFRLTGYSPDCDGSLLAEFEHVNRHGEATGWRPNQLGLYPDADLVVSDPNELWLLADPRPDECGWVNTHDRVRCSAGRNHDGPHNWRQKK